MTKSYAEALKIDLLDIIEAHDLSVSVGLMRKDGEWGVSVTARQPDLDFSNGGRVVADDSLPLEAQSSDWLSPGDYA